MDRIVIYSTEDLNGILAGAVGDGSTYEWLTAMRSKVADIVKAKPEAYLTFGPWWWTVKRQLVGAGLMAGEVDVALAEEVSTGVDALDMAGAVAFHGYNVDQLRVGNSFVVGTESGDVRDYTLVDPDMQRRIAPG
jgi:hypothetical protein